MHLDTMEDFLEIKGQFHVKHKNFFEFEIHLHLYNHIMENFFKILSPVFVLNRTLKEKQQTTKLIT